MSGLIRPLLRTRAFLPSVGQASVLRTAGRSRTFTQRRIAGLPLEEPSLGSLRTYQSGLRTQWQRTVSRSGCHSRNFSSSTKRTSPNGYPGNPKHPGPQDPLVLQLSLPERGTRAWYGMIAFGCGVVYYVVHLEKVPETGRWRFMDSFTLRLETRAVKSELADLKREYSGRILPPNHYITQHIRNIVQAILEANNLGVVKGETAAQRSYTLTAFDASDSWDPDARMIDTRTRDGAHFTSNSREWELIVVDDSKTVNAAALPGAIIVFTGILPVARDEQGLAAVLGHEIAHVVARHTSEKLALMSLLRVLTFALTIFGFDYGLSDTAVQLLLGLPNSRTVELEADKIGLQLAARACFDPRGAPAMQERLMAVDKGPLNVSFLQTHPAGKQRVKRLMDALPEAYAIRASSGACGQLLDDFDAFRQTADRLRVQQQREFR